MNYPLRLYSGKDALENLPAEMKRQRATRALVVCGRTVSRKTGLIQRIRTILGEACAGVFDEMEKESPLKAILRARDAARVANADLLIGVGAGSVIQATRVVAILLAEKRPVEELITQYPEQGPAISPKLLEPKLPIINVLTAATSAQNRAGSAVKSETVDHRMEFFDPKTRPVAVFWDADALLTAPATLARDTGAAVLWRAVMNLGATRMNPLVEGDRLQAFRLARDATARLAEANDAGPRIDLCAAAFLQNRDADEGGTMFERHWAGRVIYAFAAALFNVHPHVSQGAANCALSGTVIRRLGARNLPEMARIAQALGAWNGSEPLKQAPQRAADSLDALFRSIGMPTRVGELDVPKESVDRMLEHALKNFNADPKREFVRERDVLREVLLAAW
ncbi:MAG TPA: iron-containing alcohol dehydrogenase family protein [Burkholderiales bacterium]|nr:iron-containing alcohol dehydrogenase family protein [Burkholderiales bacterium]